MSIDEAIEQHARKIVAAAARTQVRKAVRKYYVYVWIRHTGEPIYVGKGCGPRAYREFEKGNVHLAAIIKKDREAGVPEPRRILVAQSLFEQPSTMEELCAHIKVMPPLGPYKGAQPATEDSVSKALRYIAARTAKVTKYRLVLSEADVYSIIIQEDGL